MYVSIYLSIYVSIYLIYLNVLIEDDEVMVSFVVTFLYANIPIIYKLYIIKDYVNRDGQFTKKRAISQDKFLDLVNLVLTTTL